MGDTRIMRQTVIPATASGDLPSTGISGAALNATVIGNWFEIEGHQQLAVDVAYTYSAATQIQIYVDLTHNRPGAGTPTAYEQQTASVATGVSTLNDFVVKKNVTASKNFEFRLTKLNHLFARIRATSTAGAAGDLITVNCIKAAQ